MRVNQINTVNFGVTVKKTVIEKIGDRGCYNEIREGAYKDFTFTIYDSYRRDKRISTLIFVKKAGKFLTSKLKYDVLGKKKVIWHDANYLQKSDMK